MCMYYVRMCISLAGTKAYDELCTILTKPALLSDIKKLSLKYQTSSVEGYHSVITHFAPKLLSFSYEGMACRYVCHLSRIKYCAYY